MSDDMAVALQRYLRIHWPDHSDATVCDLQALKAGWESDVYAFDLEVGPAQGRRRLPLVLRMYPGDAARAKSSREFRGMRALATAGYPVPFVHLLEQEASPFGHPFIIMDRAEGTPMWPPLFGSDRERSQALLTQFCALQVALHRLDWRPLVPDPAKYDADPYAVVDRALREMGDWIGRLDLTDFCPPYDWLMARRDRAACARPSAVHLDLHPENVLLHPDGSATVIDWTQVTVSDARFDLASTLVLVGCVMGDAWRDRLLAEYERQAGSPVTELEFFDAYACLRRLLIVAVVVHHGPDMLGLRGDVLATMKRQKQHMQWVYDRLISLTGLRVSDVERILSSFDE